MKKFYTLLSTLLIATAAVAQDATPGIAFPSQTSTYSARNTVRVDDAVIGDSKAFTISAWVYINTTSNGQFGYSNYPLFGLTNVSSYGVTTNADVCLDTGTFTLKTNKATDGTPQAGTVVEGASNAGEKQTWTHIAMAIDDEAGEGALYINGSLVQTATFTPGIIFRDGEDVVFHMTNAYTYTSVPTNFDDLKITNRLLTADEVADLVYTYPDGYVPEYVVGYYTFDANNGTDNVFPNLGHGDAGYTAQVLAGTSGYTGMEFIGTVSSSNVTGDGIVANDIDHHRYTVTATAVGDGTFTINKADGSEFELGTTAAEGETLTIDATPADGLVVSSITVNGTPIAGTTFTVAAASEIVVTFAEGTVTEYGQVTADDGTNAGGSWVLLDAATDQQITPTGGYYTIEYGTTVQVAATASEGYRLAAITVNGKTLDLANPTFTINLPNYEIVAEFIQQFTVTYTATAGGKLSVTTADGEIVSGSSLDANTVVTITATPDEGYRTGEVTVDGEAVTLSAEGSYTFTLSQNTTIEAAFVAQYRIKVWVEGNGTVTLADSEGNAIANGQLVDAGTEVTVTVGAAEGYRLDIFGINGEAKELVEGKCTFTMDQNTTIEAMFVQQCSVTYSAGEGGTVSVSTLDGTVLESGSSVDLGSWVVITCTPADSFELDQIIVNDEPVEDADVNYNLAINGNTTINVTFKSKSSGVAQLAARGAARYDSRSHSLVTAWENATISVYSLDGRAVLTATGSEVSVAGLAKGAYIAVIDNGTTVEKVKFCK